MKFSQWKYHGGDDYLENICPGYEIKDGILTVRTAGERYSSAQFDSISYDINPGCNHRICYSLETVNPMARVIFGWYKGEQALVKGYLEKSGEEILCPDGAEYLKITFRFGSHGKYEGKIMPVSGECTGEYKPRKVKLAAVAIPHIFFPKSQPVEYNMEETLKQIDRLCKREKPDLIVLTETFYTRKTLIRPFEACLPEDSEPVKIISEKAKEYNTWIAFSFHEEENGLLYNSGFLIDRNGRLAGKCHKCHLTMSEYENGLTPGEEIKVFDTEIGKIGFAICWDIFFPEHVRALRKKGVEIIVNPTAGYREERIAERCREAGAHIVTSVAAGYEKTAIFNPLGEKLCDASANYGYVIKEIDLNKPEYMYYLSYDANCEPRRIYHNEARYDLY